MATEFKGLERWKQLQTGGPIGSASSLRPSAANSPVGREYRRQQQDYGIALRLLRRQARRGDAGAAMNLLDVGDKARAEGDIRTGGLRGDGEMQGNAIQRSRDAVRDSETLERAQEDNNAFSQEQRGIGRPAAAPTRTGTALDILEGAMGGDEEQRARGETAARTLGVRNPGSILSSDPNKVYRKTLDSALGQATTPEEIAGLRERGARFGVAPEAFDRRAKWWERNR